MTLAYVQNWRGRSGLALRLIDTAIADLKGVERARATAQRGAIRHQLGRVAEAMDDYRAALPVLRRAEDLLWVQRVLSNRGVAHTERREFAAAQADLMEARRICKQLNLDLLTGIADQNLGTVEAFEGRIPEALEYYGRAESRFRELGSLVGSVLLDKSEVLLSARLVREAREAAHLAVVDFQRERRRLMVPDARLLLARVAQVDGDTRTARFHARLAAREFDRIGRTEWAALARLGVMALDANSGRRTKVTPIELAALVDATHGLRPDVVVEAWLGRALVELRHHRSDAGAPLLRQASAYRVRGPATLRARGWYAEALLRQSSGNSRGAKSAARAGLRILDDYGSALGATDLRATVAAHRIDVARLGLRIALDEKSAVGFLTWAELGKASHLLQAPARPPDDPRLAGALADLRAVVHEIGEATDAGHQMALLTRRRIELEQRVRDISRRRRAERPGATVAFRRANLMAALGQAALVEYVGLDGELYVVTLLDGRVRLRALGPVTDVAALAERLPFALHRLARRSSRTASRTAATDLLRTSAAQLDALLLGPLRELGDRQLVIVPTGPLQWMPWSVLPSCVGRPVTVVPAAALWQKAVDRPTHAGHVAVAAGPALPGARDEAHAVAGLYGASALVDDAATVQAVTSQLGGAALAHLAAHGRVRGDNPQFGSLRLADGPLMIYDLEKLDSAPHTVVLAACDAGRPVAPVGDELLGLTVTLLAQGSTQLIAPVLPILDVETGPVMTSLHGALAARHPPAVALAATQQKAFAEGPEGLAAAAAFVCFGAGFTEPAVHIDATLATS